MGRKVRIKRVRNHALGTVRVKNDLTTLPVNVWIVVVQRMRNKFDAQRAFETNNN